MGTVTIKKGNSRDPVAIKFWRGRGRVQVDPNTGLFQHFEHGERGNVVVVLNFRAEIFQRAGSLFRRRRIHGVEPAGKFAHQATDRHIAGIAGAPGHSRTKRHHAADLAARFQQADIQPKAARGHCRTKSRRAAADHDDIRGQNIR